MHQDACALAGNHLEPGLGTHRRTDYLLAASGHPEVQPGPQLILESLISTLEIPGTNLFSAGLTGGMAYMDIQ